MFNAQARCLILFCCFSFFCVLTIHAQSNYSLKFKNSSIYAGIDVGSKGVKLSILEMGKDAKKMHEIEFVANAQSSAGIEFFSWDFDYKNDKFTPEILLDKLGKQAYKFKAGLHHIAVKTVDNDGLENIEIIKLKINGAVERV